MKKISLKFKYNPKVAIFVFSALFFLYLLYLSIPSLYDTVKVQKTLSKNLNKDFNLNISLSNDITYRILPLPHFFVKDAKIFDVKSNVSSEVGQIKYLKIFINQSNFFNKKNIVVKRLGISKANFFFKRGNLEFVKNFLEKKFSEKKIDIKKSKIFFKDSSNNVIFIYTINDLNFFKIKNENKNIFNTKGTIFKIPIKFEWVKNFNNLSSETNLKIQKVSIDFLNKGNFIDGKHKYENILNILSNKFKTNYEFFNNSIILYSNKSIIKNTPIKYNGKIDLAPFSFNLDIFAKEFDLAYFMKNTFLINEIISSKILLNENLNGKINVKAKKLSKGKLFKNINLVINLEEGNLNLNGSYLYNKQFANLKLSESIFLENQNLLFLNGKLKLEINDINYLYKNLLISKRKKLKHNLKSIIFDFSFNLSNSNTFINRIIFIENKNKIVNSEKIDAVVENHFDSKFNFSNPILFKNFMKKVVNAYLEEG